MKFKDWTIKELEQAKKEQVKLFSKPYIDRIEHLRSLANVRVK